MSVLLPAMPNGESAIDLTLFAGLRAAYRQNEKSVEIEHTIVHERRPFWINNEQEFPTGSARAGSHSGFTIPSMQAGAGSSAVGSHGTRTESADDSWPVST